VFSFNPEASSPFRDLIAKGRQAAMIGKPQQTFIEIIAKIEFTI
jgi:hypothetical protein